ncbi:MAG: hypothetical protein M3256_03470 [Actinomycetota bacterium]|nr:hypothetical protein [Actinomycetota bacterium]
MHPHLSNTRPEKGRITITDVVTADPTAPSGRKDRLSPPVSPLRTSTPYTEVEEYSLLEWMAGMGGETGHEMLAVTALCRGAGADESVLRTATCCHVHWYGERLVLLDASRSIYPVAIDPDWIGVIGALATEGGTHRFLIRPTCEDRTSADFISGLVAAAGPVPPGVPDFDCERLRATWMAAQISRGTNPDMLLRAAGLAGSTTLDDYVEYLEWLDDEDTFSLRADEQ